jgi:predicted TIM-barrel fold metal-dependent hydrolase
VPELVLDGHTHSGFTVPFEELEREWRKGGIDGGVVFSPVEEIYDRYDPRFTDSEEFKLSRTAVHQYLLQVAARKNVYSYFFVWNDFASVPEGFVGIKWHRHAGEPTYNYDTPECQTVLDEICRRRLPIVLEEEFGNTLNFISRIDSRTVIIIPHMGGLNGGYRRLKEAGVFEREDIRVDTALATRGEIADFAESYGVERMIFGSDYPFGVPAHEKRKVTNLFTGKDLDLVLSGNLLQLLGQ